jgi:hypothetical protein
MGRSDLILIGQGLTAILLLLASDAGEAQPDLGATGVIIIQPLTRILIATPPPGAEPVPVRSFQQVLSDVLG